MEVLPAGVGSDISQKYWTWLEILTRKTVLAYLASLSFLKKFYFYKIDTSVNVIFPSSLMTRPYKLEGLPFVTLSSWVLEFEGKARANPIGGPFRSFLLG